jgi:hypothetical protein
VFAVASDVRVLRTRKLSLREAALVLGVLLLLAQAVCTEVAQNGDHPSPGVAVRTPPVPTPDGVFLEPQSSWT